MENNNRIKNFIKEHKILFIGFVLYIIAYTLNNILPPWILYDKLEGYSLWASDFNIKSASGGFLKAYMPRILSDNSFIKIFPLDFLYFGVADMAAVVHNSIYLPAALITYFTFLLDKILNKYFNTNKNIQSKAEKMLISHCYTNAMFYPLSLLMIIMQIFVEYIPDKLTDMLMFFDQNLVVKILAFLIFIIIVLSALIFLGIPAIVNVTYFFIYLIIFKKVLAAPIEMISVSIIEKNLGYTLFPGQFLSFLIALIIIILGNILLEKILEFFQKLSIMPILKLIKFIKK